MTGFIYTILWVAVYGAAIAFGITAAQYLERRWGKESKYPSWHRPRQKERTFTVVTRERSYPPIDRIALVKHGVVRPIENHHSK